MLAVAGPGPGSQSPGGCVPTCGLWLCSCPTATGSLSFTSRSNLWQGEVQAATLRGGLSRSPCPSQPTGAVGCGGRSQDSAPPCECGWVPVPGR